MGNGRPSDGEPHDTTSDHLRCRRRPAVAVAFTAAAAVATPRGGHGGSPGSACRAAGPGGG
eukprot:3366646-Pyramimonas_sp.AAC.1